MPPCFLWALIFPSHLSSIFLWDLKLSSVLTSLSKLCKPFPSTFSLFFLSETSLSLGLKSNCSKLKTWETRWTLWCFHPPNINFFCTLKSAPQHCSSFIHTLRKAEPAHFYSLYTVPFSISSWDSGLKADWTCITDKQPGRSRVPKWPTFLSQFLSLTENQLDLRQDLKNSASIPRSQSSQCWVWNNKWARCSDEGGIPWQTGCTGWRVCVKGKAWCQMGLSP